MCGLCGSISGTAVAPSSHAWLQSMNDEIIHRGPDDGGLYVDRAIGLGSRRLAILDLSANGHMPMSLGGRYHIVYNGEIYNYRELRPALQQKGYQFRSETDTEVLLALYAEHGPAMLPMLNGMFAFAIWDAAEETLFVARDRMGVKPLYYTRHEGRLLFASEPKALFAAGVPCEFDPSVWEELLYFRYVAGERTPFVGVNRLLPGHSLLWRDGAMQIQRWWNMADRVPARRLDLPSDPVAWFAETFDDAVARRCISDVPIGVLLSGGLDSGSVAAAMALHMGQGVAAFTVGFAEEGYDEAPLARQIAEAYRMESHVLRVRPEELTALSADAAWYLDAPLTHGNDPHLMAISRMAKPLVTVLMSGEGADELMGGYVRYRPLQFPAALGVAKAGLGLLPSSLSARGRVGKLARLLALQQPDGQVLFNSSDLLPGSVRFVPATNPGGHPFPFRMAMLQEAKMLYPGEPARQAMYLDLQTYLCSILDRNDRMTMAASIECREPFVDYRLVETLSAMPTSMLLSRRRSKKLLRDALLSRLPESVKTYRKWGFGVPWNTYLRTQPEMVETVRALPDSDVIRTSPIDRRWLREVVDAFLGGDTTHEALMRQLFQISVWYGSYFPRARRVALRVGAG